MTSALLRANAESLDATDPLSDLRGRFTIAGRQIPVREEAGVPLQAPPELVDQHDQGIVVANRLRAGQGAHDEPDLWQRGAMECQLALEKALFLRCPLGRPQLAQASFESIGQ